MSAIANAYVVAMERAFPHAGAQWMEDFMARFWEGSITPEEQAAVEREFAKVTRADIGREPLVIIGQGDTRQEIGAGEL